MKDWAYNNLVNRRSGVICPHCQEKVFSRQKFTSTNCSCGKTYVLGGKQYLKYWTSAPFCLADVRVTAEVTPLAEEEEELVSREVDEDLEVEVKEEYVNDVTEPDGFNFVDDEEDITEEIDQSENEPEPDPEE